MKILMLCADWGVPLGGNAGSSVHFRAIADAFLRLGHEVQIVATNTSGERLPECPVHGVHGGRLWPAVTAGVERLRKHGATSEQGVLQEPDFPSGGPAATEADIAGVASEMPASSPRDPDPLQSSADGNESAHTPQTGWKSRLKQAAAHLYYETLPAFSYQLEELVWHRMRFGAAAGNVCLHWQPDMIYERYAMCQTGGLRAAVHHSIPYFLEVNAPLSQERARRGLRQPFRLLARRDERLLWGRADNVFCVSRQLRHQVGSVRGLDENVFVTPNGVDTEAFSPERERGTLRTRLGLENATLVGWLGSLSPERGVEEFIALMLPVLDADADTHAVIIGTGDLAGTLRKRVAEAGFAGRVHFTGGVAHEDVPLLLVDLDLAVASYPAQRDFYFSPMKLYEYMACGLPVVAGDMGQMREVVEHGVSGELIPPADLPAWSESVLHLCRDAEYRTQMGRQARARALEFGSWEGNARLIVEEWDRLSGGKRESGQSAQQEETVKRAGQGMTENLTGRRT